MRALFSIISVCNPIACFLLLTLFVKMKFITSILSVYMLLLSIYPCVENESNAMLQQEQIISAQNNNQHPLSETDACTPFCSCSHCPASAFHQFIAAFSIMPVLFDKLKPSPLRNDVLISFSLSAIWQPPQLSA